MALDVGTIKSYLVSLGFEADDTAYRKFTSSLSKASNEVSKHTSFMSNSWVKSGTAIVSTMGAIAASTTMLVDSLGKADLGYQKYAMNMYMARDAAKQFKIVTESMGESVESISWLKELNVQYKLLMKEAAMMELPKTYQEQMEMVRSVKFEFTRLKMEGTYALQWIGYHLINNLITPLGQTKKTFKEFNDYIRDNMPIFTKKIADGITATIHPFETLWEMTKSVGRGFGELWNSMDDKGKMAVVGAGLLGLFAVSGPFGRASMILAGLPILLDDFYTAFKGGESFLPVEVWQGFAIVLDSIARSLTTIVALVHSVSNFRGAVQNYTGYGISKVLAGAFGLKGLDWIPWYKKTGEYFNKEAESFHKAGLYNWGEASSLPRTLYDIWKPGSEEFKGVLGLASQNFLTASTPPVTAAAAMSGANSNLMETINYASKLTGIRPDLIFAQWYHETGGFTNRGARELNNLGGVRYPGSDEYRKYSSPMQFAEHWSSVINTLYPNVKGAQNPAQFAQALKQGVGNREYYKAPLEQYTTGMNSALKKYGTFAANNINITYNINGAKDPKAVYAEIKQKDQVNQALVYTTIGGLGNGG